MVYRWHRPRHPREYLSTVAKDGIPELGPPLTPDALRFEFLLNALRLKAGFDYQLFEQRTGLIWSEQEALFESAVDDGLLLVDNARVRTTPLGWRFLDDLLQRFLSPPEAPSARDMMI